VGNKKSILQKMQNEKEIMYKCGMDNPFTGVPLGK
jgi:hypothetical protein